LQKKSGTFAKKKPALLQEQAVLSCTCPNPDWKRWSNSSLYTSYHENLFFGIFPEFPRFDGFCGVNSQKKEQLPSNVIQIASWMMGWQQLLAVFRVALLQKSDSHLWKLHVTSTRANCYDSFQENYQMSPTP